MATVRCGKADFFGTGRKVNEVDVDIELKEKDEGMALSLVGSVWNARKTDIVVGGQCQDELAKLPQFQEGGKYRELIELWKWHLNDMRAGTEWQEKILDEWKAGHPGEQLDYAKACEVLKARKAYSDKGYKYGSKWLYRPLPDDVVAKARKWIAEANVSQEA